MLLLFVWSGVTYSHNVFLHMNENQADDGPFLSSQNIPKFLIKLSVT